MTERTVLVRLKAHVNDFNRGVLSARATVNGLTKDIDTSSDRTAWLAQSLLALGPAVAPIGAAAVPALAALTSQLTFTAVGAGTMALAFNGVGDALKAVNDYQLEPSTQNLEKMQVAMERLGKDGAGFVRFLDDVGEQLNVLSMDARAGAFPGMERGIDALMTRLPQLRVIISETATAMGQLASQAGKGLAGDGFDAFFHYLETDARPMLIEMGKTVGNFAEGLVNLITEFRPLTRDFSSGLLDMSRAFAEWSRGLDENQGFQDFLDYARESGPLVLDLMGSLVGLFVSLARAAAPVGELLVPMLSKMADAMSVLIDTPLGSMFVTLGAAAGIYGRAAAIARITTGGLGTAMLGAMVNAKGLRSELEKTTPTWRGLGKAAAPAAFNMGLFALSMSGLPEKAGLSNTALGAMVGTIGGPWGVAVGAGVGLLADLALGSKGMQVSTEDLTATLDQQTGAVTRNTKEWLASQFAKDSDVMRSASEMGISLRTLTDAALGNAAAIDAVNAAFDRGKAGFYDEEGHTLVGADEMDHYRENVENVGGALEETGGALRDAKGNFLANKAATDAGAAAYDNASRAVQNFTDQMTRANRVLDRRASLRDYQASLDDFTKSLEENGKKWRENGAHMSRNAPLWRELEGALDTVASNALKAAQNLDKADRPNFLHQARQDFMAAARELGYTKGQAAALASELGLVDKSRARPKVDLDHGAFDAAVAAAKRRLAELNGDEAITYVTTVMRTLHQEGRLTGQHAAGGYIRGPGSTTSDSIPAWLSDREYVVKAAAVAKYGVKMMDRINTMSFAAGGYTGGSSTPGTVQTPGGSGTGGIPWDEFRKIMEQQRDAIKDAISKFTVDVDSSLRDFTVGFNRLQKRIEAAGGNWTTALARDQRQVERLAEKYQRLQGTLEAQQQALAATNAAIEDVNSKRAGLEGDVAGAFNGSITGGGIAGALKTLTGDIANRTAMDQALAALRNLGLDVTGDRSGLYNELVRSGDLKTAQQLVAGGAGTVDQFESLYAQRSTLNAQSAAAQGELAFGAMQQTLADQLAQQQADAAATQGEIRDAKHALRSELRDLRDDLKDVVPDKIGKKVGDEVNGAVATGHRMGRNR